MGCFSKSALPCSCSGRSVQTFSQPKKSASIATYVPNTSRNILMRRAECVAIPIRLGRIRLSEVNRAIREDGGIRAEAQLSAGKNDEHETLR